MASWPLGSMQLHRVTWYRTRPRGCLVGVAFPLRALGVHLDTCLARAATFQADSSVEGLVVQGSAHPSSHPTSVAAAEDGGRGPGQESVWMLREGVSVGPVPTCVISPFY